MIILEGKIGIILERKTIVHMSLSSYYSNLYITLQINIFNFLPPFWLWITKNKICPLVSLERTIPGPSHYPDGNRTSEIWALGTRLTAKESSTWHLFL